MSLSYFLGGFSSIAFALIAVIFTFVIYSAKPKSGNYLYSFIWVINIMLSCYVGYEFKLSIFFYVFLFAIAVYYYLSYTKDPFSDKAIPFIVILSSLGTTLKEVSFGMFIPCFLGAFFTLLSFRIVYKDKWNMDGFQTGLYSKSLYANRNRNVLLRALVFGLFLSLSLFFPQYLGLERPYWSSLTFVFLLFPQTSHVVRNTVQRFIGAVLAAFTVVIIASLVGDSRIAGLIVIMILVFLFPTFNKLNKLVKAFAVTLLILLLLEYSLAWSNLDYPLLDARIYETFIGGCLAILGSFALNFLDRLKKNIL